MVLLFRLLAGEDVLLGFSYLTNSFNIPGLDGPQINDLTGYSKFLLSHVSYFPQHMNLKKAKQKTFIITRYTALLAIK